MKVPVVLRSNVTAFIGVVLCAWAAAMACFFFEGRDLRLAVPICFLLVIPIVAIRCGSLAGMLGSLVSALIFAVFLFPPLGSVAVVNKAARTNLSWLILGGLAFSYLLGPNPPNRQHHH